MFSSFLKQIRITEFCYLLVHILRCLTLHPPFSLVSCFTAYGFSSILLTENQKQNYLILRQRQRIRYNHIRRTLDALGAERDGFIVKVKGKAVPLHAKEALGGRGGIAPTHSRLGTR
jgi:hypothetical protein